MPEEKLSTTTPVSQDIALLPDKEQTTNTVDIFERDWVLAERYWKRKHKVWDYGYLNYKCILTNTNALGTDYIRAFGLNVFVPLTYQAVQSIASQLNGSKTEFVVKSASGPNGFLDAKRAHYFQTMDNTEWKRSQAEIEKRMATFNALLFGIGYLDNKFEDDTEEVMIVKLPEEEDTAPESAVDTIQENPRTVDFSKPKELEWVPREVTRYRGVKLESLNPYYVFPDPNAKGDKWRYCYRYITGTVDQIREFTIKKGWLTKEEAFEKITATGATQYDAIRNMIDTLFEAPLTKYTRGDHTGATGVSSTPTDYSKDNQGDFCALIERQEPNFYEVRLGDAKTEIYKDWNIYPHKEITITPIKDNPTPDEICGTGEPELLRWQQIETNRLHNLLLDSVMMAVVQRYAINGSLLDDPTDASFHNPFRPIKLKALPGISVASAIMPLPQPEVKESPFRLLEQIKQIAQSTTGASDFIVSANESIADTATESNNLLAATTMRIKDKARYIQETALPRIIKQWHANFYYFYDEEMDFEVLGEDSFIRWLPFDRKKANTDEAMVLAAREKLDAVGETLEDVYKNAGYNDVVFLSDVMDGSFNVEVRVMDVEADKAKTLEDLLRVAKVGNEANTVAKENGETRRIDTFEIIIEALKQVTSLDDVKKYITGNEVLKKNPLLPQNPMEAMAQQSAGADGLTGIRQGQTTPSPELPDVNAEARATGQVGPVQATNSGIGV